MNLRVASSYFLGLLFIVAGIGHFFADIYFARFMPGWMPAKHFLVYASGAVEIVLGAGLFIPRFRTMAAMGILALLVLYLPLHVIDLNRYMPVIGSKALAWLRLPAQVVLIVMAYLATQWEKR